MAVLSASFAVLASIAIWLIYFCYSQWRQSRFMSAYPWLGTDSKTFFPKLRARMHNVKNFQTVIQGAYQEYSLRNQTCILPTLANDLILLPPDHIDWIISQPDSILSSGQPHIDSLQGELTFSHPHVLHNPVHHQVIHRELTRQLGNLTDDIADEICNAVDLFWPKAADDFQSVHVFGTLMRTVARTSNRIFVGLPLCRNDIYLSNAAGFAREVPTWAARLKQLPPFTRPLVAAFGLRKNRAHIRAFTALLTPEIQKRQETLQDTEKATAYQPNDALQWLIALGDELGGVERDPAIIAGRLLALNFASIHTSTFTITNAIFDLISADPSRKYIEQLREEAETVLAEGNGRWTKTGLARMYKIDSALRESSRLGSFLGPGMVRKVLAKEGVTTPNGTHCPYGSNIALATNGVHNDPSHYPSSSTYDPFRFSRQRTSPSSSAESSPSASSTSLVDTDSIASSTSSSYIAKANLAFVSTSATYHPFGHGKHCCPGRFFAANELKLMLAYLVMNYDFELLEQRPPSFWRGIVYVPPMFSSIRVRRRRCSDVGATAPASVAI